MFTKNPIAAALTQTTVARTETYEQQEHLVQVSARLNSVKPDQDPFFVQQAAEILKTTGMKDPTKREIKKFRAKVH